MLAPSALYDEPEGLLDKERRSRGKRHRPISPHPKPARNGRGAGDTVRINGQPPAREQIRADGGLVIYREHNGPASYEVAYPAPVAESPAAADVAVTVPPGEFFTLGDNRHSARDSRFDGTVPFDHIVAKKF